MQNKILINKKNTMGKVIFRDFGSLTKVNDVASKYLVFDQPEETQHNNYSCRGTSTKYMRGGGRESENLALAPQITCSGEEAVKKTSRYFLFIKKSCVLTILEIVLNLLFYFMQKIKCKIKQIYKFYQSHELSKYHLTDISDNDILYLKKKIENIS